MTHLSKYVSAHGARTHKTHTRTYMRIYVLVCVLNVAVYNNTL